MKNYIYCYTNLINGKKYVGQTNDLKRRDREHKSNAFNPKSVNYNNIIHKAFRKYGYENFNLEVLEELNDASYDEVNSQEGFWIKEKKSLISEHGYNVLESGENEWHSFLNREIIQEIKDMIKQGICYTDICNKYGISKTFVSNINCGLYFHNEEEKYPLYKYRISDETYSALIEDLEKPELTFKELANKYGLAESTVKKFNYGSLRAGYYEGEYPIRKITPAEYKANIIKDLLLNTSLSKKEIVKISKTSDETVRRINIGNKYEDKTLSYPLRK